MAIHLAVFSQSNYNLKFEENEFSFLETAIGYQILPKSADYYLLGDTTNDVEYLIITSENLKVKYNFAKYMTKKYFV